MRDASPSSPAERFACLWRFEAGDHRLSLSGAVADLGLGLDPGDDLLPELICSLAAEDRRGLDAAFRAGAPGAPVLLRLHAEAGGAASLWRGAWNADASAAEGVALPEPSADVAAAVDALTGLLSRTAFMARLDGRARRGGGLRLLLADISRFGRLNEALGVERADLVLAALAGRLLAAYGPGCAPARVGDDEFALILPSGDEDAGVALRAVLERPLRIAGCDIHPAMAVGVVAAAPGEDVAAPELMRRAGLALEAGREGRSGAQPYHVDQENWGVSRLALEADLRGAFGRGEFEAWLQPIITLATGEVAGFEALARWRHPQHGLLPPDDFIPLLAAAGLTGALGRRMTRLAALQLAAWREEGRGELFVSVNLTCAELERPSLVAEVAEVISQHGLPTGALKLELTESEVMRDPEGAAEVMRALRAAGAGIAIDDFGMGFSSLSYLARLPVSVLKIDRYFVSAMATSPEAGAIIRSVAQLGAELRLDIVAEGIEDAAAAEALAAMGCRYGQGYGFSPPLPPTEATAFLAASVAKASPRLAAIA